MKILFIGHTYINRVNQEKLIYFAKSKIVKVGLIAPQNWKSKKWGRSDKLYTGFQEVKYYPRKVFFNGIQGGHIYLNSDLKDAILDFNPDIVHVDQETFSLSAYQIAKITHKLKIPLVVFSWENIADKPLSFIRKMTKNYVLKTARAIVAGNKGAEYALRKWGYEGRIEVIPQYGVELNYKSGNTDKEFIIGYSGKLIYSKGIDVLLAAAEILKNKELSFKIIILGYGSEKKRLQKIAEEKNINEIIIWKDAVEPSKSLEIMREFSVLVLPSRATSSWKEQFGRVIIESMAMGIPVIGSMSAEIPRIIGHNELLFPEDDEYRLAVLLENLIKNKTKLSDMQQYCYKRIKENYIHDIITSKYINLWNNIIKTNLSQNH